MTTFNNGAVDNNFGTDAEWRAWCIEYEKALLASGFLVAASDTGQIDFATAVRPAVGTYAGYKIYKASDALQATKPLFVKVEYGVASVNNRPKIQIGIGSNSNGSGTLGGSTSPGNLLLNPSADGSGASRIFGGGGPFDAWAVTYDGASTSNACHFHIGRLLDRDDGSVEVGPMAWFTYLSGSSGTPYGSFLYSDLTGSWGSLSSILTSLAPDLSTGFHSGGDINKTLLYELLVYRNAKTLVIPAVVGRAQELPFTDPVASQITMTVWGGFHTFVPIPFSSGTNNRPCLLWE